ncbi:MFS transporter [Thermoleptolyngbya oregonensis NK1-22]|uniref:MFS transporter n=1 Tax=Thermoleptolyngbya oregonensis NK1-22 TaxID=2547457 RepID=A0AA96Y3M1_9CYAN|nr:MFS transporter [Thermoleptolyngbya oregonensis]WOB41899.1 MFS transporter [Thermoleptolyngbya oregonensis NK1-22]
MSESASKLSKSSKSPEDTLSFGTKLAYGAGDLGTAITANILAVFLLVFFTSVAGIPAGIAGSILLVGKIWDAVNDPIVGILSDRTQSRWGRRYPWIVAGAIPFGVFFFLQWIVPRFSDNPTTNLWALVAYYIAVSVLFNAFYTVVNLPYTALTPELTDDYDERTSLNSFRFIFSIGGSILSLVIVLAIFNAIPDDVAQQYRAIGAICAVISVLPFFWCVFGTYGHVTRRQQLRGAVETSTQEMPILQQLKVAFANRPFLFVIGIYLCSWLALQNTVTIIPYFVRDWMGLSNAVYTQVVMAVQVTALAMLLVWERISRRVGKKAVYILGMVLWVMAEIGLFFLQPGQVGWMYFLGILAGMGVSTAYLIPWSMVPDVIDLDELHTGQRREGVFYSFMVFLQKMGLAIALFLVGLALDAAGFIESTAGEPTPIQPASALTAIRVMIGPLPAIVLLLGIGLAYFYPISREVHANILLQLHERKHASENPPDTEPDLR